MKLLSSIQFYSDNRGCWSLFIVVSIISSVELRTKRNSKHKIQYLFTVVWLLICTSYCRFWIEWLVRIRVMRFSNFKWTDHSYAMQLTQITFIQLEFVLLKVFHPKHDNLVAKVVHWSSMNRYGSGQFYSYFDSLHCEKHDLYSLSPFVSQWVDGSALLSDNG